MNLPEVLETRRAEKDLHRLGLSAFSGAVVRDDDARLKGMREEFRVDVAMASSDLQVDCTETVIRTHQFELPVQRQIAQMKGSKFSERNEAPDRLIVLGPGNIGGREIGASRIRSRRTRKRRLQNSACGGHHTPVQTRNRNL